MVVPAIRAQRVVVGAHRHAEPGGDRLLPDAEMGRAPDQPLEEQLLRPRLEEPALHHDPVQGETGLPVEARGGGGNGRHRSGAQ